MSGMTFFFFPVGVDSGLFYAGNGGSNPAKLNNLCDFFESRQAVSGEPFATLFALHELATRWTLTRC